MTRSFHHTLSCDCIWCSETQTHNRKFSYNRLYDCISRDTLSRDSCVLPTHVPNRSALEFVYIVTVIMLEISPIMLALCFRAPIICRHNQCRPNYDIILQVLVELNFVGKNLLYL